MNNILILNLGTKKDFIASAQTIASLRAEYPKAQIEVVTKEENRDLAEIMNSVGQFHFINSTKIQNIIENPLYSDAFAINEFSNSIFAITNQEWDRVINFSNDNISAYLMSAVKSQEKCGAFINSGGAHQITDNWSLYQNYVLAKQNMAPIDIMTIRNHIAKVAKNEEETECFKHNEEYTAIANQNFNKIRNMKSSSNALIIGINLEVGFDGYNLSTDTLEDIIEAIEESNDYKTVLLLSGKNYQREIVNSLNAKFNNGLISINLDTVALPSVMSNVDMLVSPANTQLMIADNLEIRTIEIREDSKQRHFCSTKEGNFIFKVNSEESLADDIILAINEEFGTALPVSSLTSTNKTYKAVYDQYSHFYTQIRGEMNLQEEVNYHIERSYFLELLGYERNTEALNQIAAQLDSQEIEKYITNIKAEMTSTVKVLLATLRSLKSAKKSPQMLNQFISYLDTLILIGQGNGLVPSIVRFFEGEVDNIYCDNADENLKAIEDKLFALKGYLQMTTQYMETLTSSENPDASIVDDKIDQGSVQA